MGRAWLCEKFDGNSINQAIVVRLQESGVAVPSTTTIHGRLAIMVNITNHRPEFVDLDSLIAEVEKIGDELTFVAT